MFHDGPGDKDRLSENMSKPPEHSGSQSTVPPSDATDADDRGCTEAGVIRAAVRSSINIYRSILFGSFPRRVPLKTVSKITDQVSTAWDAYSVFKGSHKEATRDIEVQNRPQHKESLGTAGLHKAQLFGQTLRSAVPHMVKSGFLGTAVFEMYETSKDTLDNALGLDKDVDGEASFSTSRDVFSLSMTGITGLISGGLAGTCHGLLYVGWEHARRLINAQHVVANVWTGTALAHSLAHASLFGSFEVLKDALLAITHARHEEPLGVFVVGAAGGLAGLVEETVSHLTPHWEKEGVSSLRAAFKRNGLPRLRVISSAALPTSLGFLAWEYGRHRVLRCAGEEEG